MRGLGQYFKTLFRRWFDSGGLPLGRAVAAQLVASFLMCGGALLADMPGRVLYRDGSPCAFCWLDLQVSGHSSRLRVDGDGYFQLPVESADEIRRLRAEDQAGERLVEKDFLFFVLHKNNPRVEPLLKDLRGSLQFFEQGISRETTQQVMLENCIFSVERLNFVEGRVLEDRLVAVDLTKLEKVEACEEESSACIHLQPARVEGERHQLDGTGGAVLFGARHRDEVPSVLQSLSLLARACGNFGVEAGFQ